MRTITGKYTSVYCFDAVAWLQDRLIIYYNGSATERDYVYLWSSERGTSSNPIVIYRLDAGHKCTIDVTDYIRTYMRSGGSIYVAQLVDDGSGIVDTLAIPFTIGGLINPAGVYIPPFNFPLSLIVPPERVLYAGITDIRSEFYKERGSFALSRGASFGENERVVIANSDFSILYRPLRFSRKTTFLPTTIDACKEPAVAVRWLSFTGIQRVHHYMLRKPTIAAADSYQLLTPDNSFNEIKGRLDSFDLYLDDLTPYDLWYYADVVTSSKVEVSLDGKNWNQVQVTTKNVTVPTGVMGNGKLEITVNWRKYDAVTM